jgi:L-2,4-diaminobutyrate transaminase
MLRNRDLLEVWDRDHFFHPSTHLAQFARGEAPERIITGAEGCHVVDRSGKRYLDGFGGLFCVNVGYGRKEIADAIAKQAHELAYFHAYAGHGTEASITLAKMVIDRAPKGMSRVFFGLGGSDANETNVKLVWYYNNVLDRPQKKKIISRWRAFHGSGLVSGSMTGLSLFHKAFDLPFPQIVHTEAPYYFRRADDALTEEQFSQYCADELEKLILKEGPDTVAAFIGEPMMGTGGIVPPPKGYWERIQAVLAKYDVLLLVDEVVTGFYRLGTNFGSHYFGIKPDLMSIAKGLTSAYAPISGSVVSEKVWKVLEAGTDKLGPFGHGWTYSAHPICAAAGVANLELMDKLNLKENVKDVGPYMLSSLKEAVGGHSLVGEVRGAGLLMAVELAEDKKRRKLFDPPFKVAPRVVAAMMEKGVIARAMPQADTIGLSPPLCITRKEADTIVSAVADSIKEIGRTL